MEGGMQQVAEEAGPQSQTSSEGPRRLNLIQRLYDRAYSSKARDPLVEEAANEIRLLLDEVTVLRSELYRDRIVVVDGGIVLD